MSTIDIIASFEREINKLDDSLEKPVTDDSLYWLNQAIVKFVKERFNGNAPKRTSYEQNEKRTKDLINLLVNKDLTPIVHEVSVNNPVDEEGVIGTPTVPTAHIELRNYIEHATYHEYQYIYPTDMMFILNEDVVICNNEGEHKLDVSVFECTADSFMYRVNNSLTDFHYKYHKARPLRIRTTLTTINEDGFEELNRGCSLLTDGNYKIDSYSIGYLKIPSILTNEDPYKKNEDFPEYIWPEIIKIAAQMYVENQADPRYQTLTNEVLTQE